MELNWIKPWYGFDLDGTLAIHESKNFQHGVIGDPIPRMVNRLKSFIRDGEFEVKIFTARAWSDGSRQREREREINVSAIKAWCVLHIGTELEITCTKDIAMRGLYDDRAFQVELNTGLVVGEVRPGSPLEETE